jgi:cyclophilin family peptidyl-prolyl cis-trans isomerase
MNRRSFLALGIAASFGVACQSGPGTPTAKPTTPPVAATSAAPKAAASPGAQSVAKQWSAAPANTLDPNAKYSATIKTSHGDMKADLFSKDAPNTVNNFVFLARENFYDGVIFHRIIKDFMVQTGDPTGTGMGGPGYRFADELSTPQGYARGTLAMANAGPNTQGSQFFICHTDLNSRLPKNYTVFGLVTQGLEVLDAIAGVPVGPSPSGERSKPQAEVKIQSVTIEETK